MKYVTIEHFFARLQIERDFERKYPEYKDRLILSWNLHFEKLYKLLEKNLSTGDQLNEVLMQSQSLDLSKYLYPFCSAVDLSVEK